MKRFTQLFRTNSTICSGAVGSRSVALFLLRHIIHNQVSYRVVDHDSRFIESLVDLLDQLTA